MPFTLPTLTYYETLSICQMSILHATRMLNGMLGH